MMKFSVIALLSNMVFFTSCFIPAQQAYYLSPQHATTNHYKTIPLVSDSLSSATYVSGIFTAGGANHRLRDGLIAFQGNIHQARQWNHLQVFYGASLSAGTYDIEELSFPGNHVDAIWINERAGSKFHGGMGLQGGVNYVIPFRHGEWRVLGVEGNLHHEYGDYLRFRRDLPEDAANLVERSRSYNNFLVSSDIIRTFSDGSRVGYKFSYVQSFRRLYGVQGNDMPIAGFPRYATHTLHITVNRWTGYGQLNFGSEATNVQLGLSARILSSKR